jgi:hypothetical protein
MTRITTAQPALIPRFASLLLVIATLAALPVPCVAASPPATTRAAADPKQPPAPEASDLLLHLPSYPFVLGTPNPPYPQPGEMLVRRFAGKKEKPQWVPLTTPDLVPIQVGPHAAILLAWDKRAEKVVFYSSRDGQPVLFSYEDYPSAQIDDRGLWTIWPIAPDIVRRYDLRNRKWVETNEPPPPSEAVREGDLPGTTKVRLPNGEFKQIPCKFAYVTPWLPQGQVIAVVAGQDPKANPDLCVWDVTQNKPLRILWRGAANYHYPSPSGRLMLIWIESSTDLIFGWHYTLIELQDGRQVDRFTYNIKGGDRLIWAPCTQNELETTLRAVRDAIDRH